MKLLAFFLVILALPAIAGQAPRPQPTNPPTPLNPMNPTGDDSMLKELMDRMKDKVYKDKESGGSGNVPKAGAALCDVCNQPLFRHGDPNFQCTPIDRKTGLPRVLPHITTTEKLVQCPVCPATFAGVLPGNINVRGGRDRDFCVHSIGKVTVHSDVWMCPECGYAAMIPRDQKAEGFQLGLDGKPVDAVTKQFVREKLSDATRTRMIRVAGLREGKQKMPEDLQKFSRYVAQNEIPDWIKYNNALLIYESQKAPHTLLAHLYIEGAHACRREVCSEVSAPALQQEMQEALGKSITRMNKYVQSECLAIRRKRGESLDPTKAETDPRVLSQATASLLKIAKELNARRDMGANPQAGETYFSKCDLYVLNIVHAGALDRIGNLEEADKALGAALAFVPEHITMEADNKDLEEYATRQLKLLRGIIQDRQTCLHHEQEYLFKAARRNMAAIDRSDVKFKSAQFDPKAKSDGLADPAPTAYVIGELMRRASVPEAGAAWFTAARRIAEKKLELLDAAVKANPPAPVIVALPDSAPVQTPFEAERERLMMLRNWSRDQAELIGKTKGPDEVTEKVIEKVLASVGLSARVEVGAGVVQPAGTNDTAVKTGPEKVDIAPVASGPIKTREQLYKIYYAALIKYRTAKKENAPKLSELVAEGLISQEESCLDENGKLTCPETKERLIYLRQWEPGEKDRQVIIPSKAGSKVLYASGEIR